MKIQGGITGPSEAAYLARSGGVSRTRKSAAVRRFDSITISQGGVSFEKELRSRLTREVRTASASSETVGELRRQVQEGTYHPDPMAIARKMVLLGEDF